MKIKTILLIALFLLNRSIYSQTGFQRVLGGMDHDRAQTIINASDSAFIINGASLSFGAGSADATLFKLSKTGQTIWSYAYGSSEYDNSEYAIEAFDHSIVCTGRSVLGSGQPESATIFKTDSAGTLQWTKAFGGIANDGLVQIIETSDHGYAAIGNTKSISSGANDILLVRTDAGGDTIFTRSYGTVEDEIGLSLLELPDNGFIISGRQTTFNTGSAKADGLVLRTNSNGNIIWSKQYGDSLWEELTSVRRLANGDLIFCGSTTTFGAGTYDILLMKTDSSGNVIWSNAYGKNLTDAAYEVNVTSDNSFIASGYTEDMGYGHRGDDSSNIFLLKTDTAGLMLWCNIYGEGLQDEAFRSSLALDGGYMIPGFTTNFLAAGDSSQMLFIKTDNQGQSGCHQLTDTPVVTPFIMPSQNIVFTTLSGLPFSSVTLTQTPVVITNDDACLFASQKEISADNTLKVFPNPFQNKIQVEINRDEKNIELRMIDVCGREISKQKIFNGVNDVATANLSPGIYFIEILADNSILKSIKVVKQ